MPDIDRTKSRMVFTYEQLKTDALTLVKRESLPALHKDIAILLDEHCLNNDRIENIYFTATGVKKLWFNFNSKIEINYINRILKTSMKLKKISKVERRVPFQTNSTIDPPLSGRYFVFNNKYYKDDTNSPENTSTY